MKLKSILSLKPNATQRYAHSVNPDAQPMNTPPPVACTARRDSPFSLLATRSKSPLRIPPPIINARPILRGSKSYLRALRAAEMAIWNANRKFPVTIALLFAVVHAGARII
jgi:hypothetical protein